MTAAAAAAAAAQVMAGAWRDVSPQSTL